jgi:hypothetical protein
MEADAEVMPHELLPRAEAIEGTLAELRRQVEELPEGNSLRVTVETYLGAVEKQAGDEVDALRKTVGSRRNR